MNSLPCTFVNLKRKAEEPLEPSQVKKVCLEKKPVLFELRREVVDKIFDQLSTRDLLAIDSAAKGCSALIQKQWEKRQKVKFSFNLHEKENCLLSLAIDGYIRGRENIDVEGNVQEKVKAVYQRFEGIMTHFPAFGAYIWSDLTQSFSSFDISPKNQKLFEDQLGYLKGNATQNEAELKLKGGDYLLKGLYQMTCYQNILLPPTAQERTKQQRAIFNCFKLAIKDSATSASLYAFLLSKGTFPIEWLDSLAQLAEHQKDFRASDAIFHAHPDFTDRIFSKHLPRPSVLWAIASKQLPSGYKAELLDEAIRLYEGEVPADVWSQAGHVKKKLGKWKKAEVLYGKAIATYGDVVPARALAKTASVKFRLNKWDEAQKFYGEAMTTYGDAVPAPLLAKAAYVKGYLNKNEEAEELYDKATAAYGGEAPALVLVNAANVKWYLNKNGEAEELYDRATAAYDDDVPAEVLVDVANVKLYLNKYEEAESLFDKAIAAYGENIPAKELADAANIKLRLNKWEEAEGLYDQTIIAYGDDVPAVVLANAGYLKWCLKKCEEANELYSQAIIAYGDDIPVAVLNAAANVKISLK